MMLRSHSRTFGSSMSGVASNISQQQQASGVAQPSGNVFPGGAQVHPVSSSEPLLQLDPVFPHFLLPFWLRQREPKANRHAPQSVELLPVQFYGGPSTLLYLSNAYDLPPIPECLCLCTRHLGHLHRAFRCHRLRGG